MASQNEQRQNLPMGEVAYNEEAFPALRLVRSTRIIRRIGRFLFVLLIILVMASIFAPWQQSIKGTGDVIAFDPFERPQPVQAPVKGRIAERGAGVQENAYVKKGQLLFRIEDQDPLYLSRLEQQMTNAQNELNVAEMRLERSRELKINNERIVEVTGEELEAMHTAQDELVQAYDRFVSQEENKFEASKNKLLASEAKFTLAEADYKRKQALYDEGIESELKLQESEQKFLDAQAQVEISKQELQNASIGIEGKKNEREAKRQEWQAKINKVESQLEKAKAEVAKAEIDINKTSEEINQKRSKLIDQQGKVAVQMTQEVLAPRDGYIMNLTVFDTSSIVKPGDQLCRIVPRTEQPAVQIWVAGNDVPLITTGRKVRLLFEGWPAVQFSGWPSVAVGTFGGEVALVDSTTDHPEGKFRVVILPDQEDIPWPKYPYLRQGVRVNGWVLLDQVQLGYEVWRRMNGFPPSLQPKKDGNERKPPKIKV